MSRTEAGGTPPHPESGRPVPVPDSIGVVLRSLGFGVYLPTVFYAIGQGALAPVIALAAFELGASIEAAGLMVGVYGAGLIAGDIPAGWLTAKVGERLAMIASAVLTVLSLLLCITATGLGLLAIGLFGAGAASAVWALARQVLVTDVVRYEQRARALSLLAGLTRVGVFVGPLLGAIVMQSMGLGGSLWIGIVAAGMATASLAAFAAPGPLTAPVPATSGTLRVARDNAESLRTLGAGIILIGAIRESRKVLIPLWGIAIGLDPATISLAFGISAGADMLLFYPAGSLMDRLGRWWGAIPALVILGLAHLLLPLATDFSSLAIVGVAMGIGNGLSSGIVMTLGADAAPRVGRPQFLAVWRLLHDTGSGVGPLLIGAVASTASLGAASMVMGAGALASAVVMDRWIPPHSGRPDD